MVVDNGVGLPGRMEEQGTLPRTRRLYSLWMCLRLRLRLRLRLMRYAA